jgi:protein-tyrosine-phosphatase
VSDRLSIGVVCSGNRFRSPLAAAVLVQELGDEPAADVFSVGTLQVAESSALPEAIALAPRYGVDLGTHEARQLRRGELRGVDLVIGFEKFHLAAAVVDGGAERSRAFTLPELAAAFDALPAISAGTPVERARAMVAAAAAQRAVGAGWRPPEIEDPFGKPESRQEAIAEQVASLATRVASGLRADERPDRG